MTHNAIPTRVLLALTCVAVVFMGVAVWVSLRPNRHEGASGSQPADSLAARWFPRRNDAATTSGIEGGRETAALSGRVLDPDGVPVAEGAVHVACASGARPSDPARLDEDGGFTVQACDSGPTCLSLIHPSMIQLEPWVADRVGPDQEWTAGPRPRVHGIIQDPHERPVNGATVIVVAPPGKESHLDSRHATTDEDGVFEFSLLPHPPCDPCRERAGQCGEDTAVDPSSHVATVAAAPWRTTEFSIFVPGHYDDDAEGDDHDMDLGVITLEAPAPPIRGRLVDPSGAHYPRAKILARSEVRAHEQHAVDVDPRGGFVLDTLGAGTYEVRALQDGVELAREQGHRAGTDVRLEGSIEAEGTRLLVRVVGPEGKSVSGARVDGGPFRGTKTDAQGRVPAQIALAPPQSMRLRARKGALQGDARVETSAGEDAVEVEIHVQPQ